MAKSFFITSTGTSIGKTLLTCALCHHTRQQGKKSLAIKPIISGWDQADEECDTIQLLNSQNIPVCDDNIQNISPWRFTAPLSPDIAARMEDKSIGFIELVNFCIKSRRDNDYLFVEGAGGIMAPINENKTMLDLIKALNFPTILTAGTYLGSISHTLSAIETLKLNNIGIHYLVVSESEDSPTALNEHVKTLENFYSGKIAVIERFNADCAKTIWTNMGKICEKLI